MNMDIPNARSHREITKKGYLQKLSSRSFPYIPHPWKRKFCLLVKGSLYYYEREDSRGADKGSGVINLEYYDQVLAAAAKDSKKASNVFTVTSQDKSFFDQGRHLFSADSAHDMNDWIRLLKRSIEQIRNNNRTTTTVTSTKSLASSTRATSAGTKITKTSKEKVEENIEEGAKGKKKSEEEEGNKENEEDWLNPGDNKKSSDTSIRRKRGDPSSKSMDETTVRDSNALKSSTGTNSIGRKKSSEQQTDETSVTSNSLGRKTKAKSNQGNPKAELKYAPGDLEGMMFGSLGRQLKACKAKGNANKGTGEDSSICSESMESSGSNLESKKRKADEEEDDILQSKSSGNQLERLESVTKHRVKGPAGRRMPQNRRAQQLMMKHRASSLSALAHSGISIDGVEGVAEDNSNTASFIPWLNRSLDLLEEQSTYEQAKHCQPQMGYLYSDQDDEAEEMFEYNIGYNEDPLMNYDEGSVNLFVHAANTDSYNANSGGPPPLPPRMESKSDYLQQNNQLQYQHYQQQQQLQQQFQLQQIQQLQCNAQNQLLSPFGTVIQKPQQRRSLAVDDMNDVHMTQSMNNELFIASFSDGDNSCEQKHQNKGFGLDSTNSSGSSPAQKQKEQLRPKSVNVRNGQQKGNKKALMGQPDINKFNVAVKNLQKHVVELDQAVNGITKEVEDSKVDLGNIKSGVVTLKKEKDRLSDSVSIISQEAAKMKEQVISALKESEKLQKTATSALVVAEKARIDQQNLKKEYENMILDLKNTIDKIKKEGLTAGINEQANNNAKTLQSAQVDEESDEDNCHDECDERDRESRDRKNKQERDSSRTRSVSKHSEKSDSKSSGYPSFFSRPSSIISGFTSKDKTKANNKSKGTKKCTKKSSKLMIDDIPMMDETIGSPMTISPVGSDHELTDNEFANNVNFDLEKSTSSPNVSNRPRVLTLKSQNSETQSQASPDSPTRASSPFDVPRFHLNGRATSPTRYSLHRPGSTPGPLSRQGSMTTVPEDRAIDGRHSDNRPSEPPPPPPTSHYQSTGVFAISRQNSSPNISTLKSSPALPRQHSLGVVFEDSKSNMSRQGSLMSVPDDRLIVDRTLTMSPSPSLMSFPGSWSTTSLNRQDTVNVDERSAERIPKFKIKPTGPLELVAGGILSGSSFQSGKIAPYEEKNDEPPLATSSLKRRKKVKKNPVMV